jgi:hypothetical protein
VLSAAEHGNQRGEARPPGMSEQGRETAQTLASEIKP